MATLSKKRTSQHPTPAQALATLSGGACMYAPVSVCSSRGASPVGLRDEEDPNRILVCSTHYPQLRKMPPAQLVEIERFLISNFHRLGRGV